MTGPFDVVFRGEIDDRFSKLTVQEALKKAIGTTDERIQKMFSGQAIYMKKDVKELEARSLCKKLAKLGAIAKVEPSLKRTTPPPANVNLKELAPELELVGMEPQSTVQTPAPQVVIVERAAAELASKPKASTLSFIISSISGLFWLVVGLWFVVSFSPFADGTVKRGAILGLVISLFGCYRIITRNKVR